MGDGVTHTWDPVLGSDPTGSTDVTDGKWHHIALVLTGYSYQAFVDGEQDMSGTYNFIPDPDTGVFRIGTGDPTHTADYSGYVDELRISKGKARYTTSFTPPTQPFGGGLRMKDPNGKIYALSLSGSA